MGISLRDVFDPFGFSERDRSEQFIETVGGERALSPKARRAIELAMGSLEDLASQRELFPEEDIQQFAATRRAGLEQRGRAVEEALTARFARQLPGVASFAAPIAFQREFSTPAELDLASYVDQLRMANIEFEARQPERVISNALQIAGVIPQQEDILRTRERTPSTIRRIFQPLGRAALTGAGAYFGGVAGAQAGSAAGNELFQGG